MVRLVMVRSVWQVVVVLDSVGKVGGVERQNSVGVAKNRLRKWIRVRWSMKVVGSSNGW